MDPNISPVDWLAQVVLTPTGEFGRRMEIAKWRGLYVDCLLVDAAPSWWSPSGLSEVDAQRAVGRARRLVGARVVSVDEVQILIRHMAPVAGATWGEVNRAQGRYLREIVDRGFRRPEAWMRTRLGFDPWADPPDAGG
jgi:hypothetical protein